MNRLFERAKAVSGSRPIPGYTVTCSQCGKQEAVTANTYGGTMAPEGIARKFRNRGWVIGTKDGDDICPNCTIKKKDVMSIKPNAKPAKDNVVSITPTTTTAIVEPPREMSRDDRRLIFAKLNEIYIDEKQGYDTGWSDKKVAQDLGVPLAWVRAIREENFGQEGGSAEVAALLHEAQEMATKARAAMQELNDAFLKEIRDHAAKIARLETRVQELLKIYGK